MSRPLHCGLQLQALSWEVQSGVLQVPLPGARVLVSLVQNAAMSKSVICSFLGEALEIKHTFGSLNAFGTL
jgi:hypothetical protein